MKDPVFQLTDTVRQTAFEVHRYFGPGHLEKVYENALVNRLRKLGLDVKQQHPLTVRDEDGTIVGDYFADLLVDNCLILELKAARELADEHVAQMLGYLRAARIEHGALLNFGAARFQIRKLGMKDAASSGSSDGGVRAFLAAALACIGL
jgi:GxxExxY protein